MKKKEQPPLARKKKEQPPLARKPYRDPVVKNYGHVSAITQGVMGGASHDGGTSTNGRTGA
jgi:hypothetical protein